MNRVPGRSDWSIRKRKGSEAQSRSEYEFMPSVSATKSVRKTHSTGDINMSYSKNILEEKR